MKGKRTALVAQLEGIYRERYRQFLRVAIGILGDEPSSHDAVQEGFARALRRLESYSGAGSFEGWTWRVVTNEILTQSARRSQTGTEAEVEPDQAAAMMEIGAARIAPWVRRLPERQRIVLFLRYYADLDYRGIANALDVEVGTVSATLSAAHAALRRSLKEVAS
jgi:RNA polymerase sigma factor (sigma-70 family)